ncbi:MAG: alpha/beta hydrolase-fold protein [Clostridiales bacterium]|nr:alpha/beta hydrolase-fold protein [Clostridiales bacterium]
MGAAHGENKQSFPVILYWGIGAHDAEHWREMPEYLEQIAPRQKYILVAYESENWNLDFSPWEAPAAFGKDNFGGGGEKTLLWLTEELIPLIEKRIRDKNRDFSDIQLSSRHILGGYSLAGLFSLWALAEKDVFSGAVCASGSLWFPGWTEYGTRHSFSWKDDREPDYCKINEKKESDRKKDTQEKDDLKESNSGNNDPKECDPKECDLKECDSKEKDFEKRKRAVYLSLGDREEKTKNFMMARVGDATRRQAEQLAQDSEIQSILEWNSGGHFKEPYQRMARGFAWILEQISQMRDGQ